MRAWYGRVVIDHISLNTPDYPRAKAFFLAALAPIEYGLVMELTRAMVPSLAVDVCCGLGAGQKPDFWLSPTDQSIVPQHIAFLAKTRAQVDAFYAAALEAGGKDNGAPGLRPHYHADYYGAFVIDPDGNNIEAVCHAPQ